MATSETIWITMTRRRFSTEQEALEYEASIKESIESWVTKYLGEKDFSSKQRSSIVSALLNNYSELRKILDN